VVSGLSFDDKWAAQIGGTLQADVVRSRLESGDDGLGTMEMDFLMQWRTMS
jgi:hypothetical protein